MAQCRITEMLKWGEQTATYTETTRRILKLLSFLLRARRQVTLSLSTSWSRIRGVEVYLHSFLSSALDIGQWSTSRCGRFIPKKECQYSLQRTLGGSQSRNGNSGEEKRAWDTRTFKCQHMHSVVSCLNSCVPLRETAAYQLTAWFGQSCYVYLKSKSNHTLLFRNCFRCNTHWIVLCLSM